MRIQVKKGPKGAWCWRLVGRNGRVLATSETYRSKRNALRAVDAFAHDAKSGHFYVEVDD